jgi:hypothetical protein
LELREPFFPRAFRRISTIHNRPLSACLKFPAQRIRQISPSAQFPAHPAPPPFHPLVDRLHSLAAQAHTASQFLLTANPITRTNTLVLWLLLKFSRLARRPGLKRSHSADRKVRPAREAARAGRQGSKAIHWPRRMSRTPPRDSYNLPTLSCQIPSHLVIFQIPSHLVILSGVRIRQANSYAVEGPLYSTGIIRSASARHPNPPKVCHSERGFIARGICF